MRRGCMDSPPWNDTLCLFWSPGHGNRSHFKHFLGFSLIPTVILLIISSSDKEQCDCLRRFSVARNTRLIFHTHVSTMHQFHFSPSDPIWVLQGVSRRAVCLCGVTFSRTGPDMKTTVSMLMWDTQSYCGHTWLPRISVTTCPLLTGGRRKRSICFKIAILDLGDAMSRSLVIQSHAKWLLINLLLPGNCTS